MRPSRYVARSVSVGFAWVARRQVVEQVVVGYLAEQRAPVVDENELRLRAACACARSPARRCAGARSCPTGRRRRRAGAARSPRSRATGAIVRSSMPSRSGGRRGPAGVPPRARPRRGSWPEPGPGPARSTRLPPASTRSSTPSPRVSALGDPVDARQCAEEVQLARDQAAARRARRGPGPRPRSISESSGSPSRSSSRVPKTSRMAVAVVGPARRADHEVQAEGQAALQPAAGSPTRGRRTPRAACSSRRRPGRRRRAVVGTAARARRWSRSSVVRASATARRASARLGAVGDDRRRGAARRGVRTCRRRSRARRTGSPAVSSLSARLGDDGAQERALAAARSADDGDVAGGAGEVERQGVAALLARTVDDAERDTRPASVRHCGEVRPELAVLAPRSGISSSRVSGTSSGGSHTGGPRARGRSSRATAMSSSDGCSPCSPGPGHARLCASVSTCRGHRRW